MGLHLALLLEELHDEGRGLQECKKLGCSAIVRVGRDSLEVADVIVSIVTVNVTVMLVPVARTARASFGRFLVFDDGNTGHINATDGLRKLGVGVAL